MFITDTFSLFSKCCLWWPGSVWMSKQCPLWYIVGCSWCSRVLSEHGTTVYYGQVFLPKQSGFAIIIVVVTVIIVNFF